MSDVKFFPPQQNPLLVRLLQSIFYIVAYFVYKIRLVVDEAEVAKLKALADQRVVYLPNHSNLDDGFALFLLSARAGQLFHYVVAFEAFEGWVGKLMQKVGAYSIRRGIGDRNSIIQTLKILQQPRCKLVIFPEGGCSYQNDTVMPFRPGAFELSFKALEKLIRKNNDVIPDFYLVPITLKYRYPNATDQQLDQALSRLETALSLTKSGKGLARMQLRGWRSQAVGSLASRKALTSKQNDFYSRLRMIGLQILSNLETEYQVTPTATTDYNQRMEILRQRMLDYCESKLDITPGSQLPNRERIYKVQSIIRSLTDLDQQSTIDYEHIYLTTVRLLNFDAIYDGYVAENPTKERFFDTIDRLEREVFKIDRPKFKGRRQIVVKIATPINLKDYWRQYQSDRFDSSTVIGQSVIDDLTKLCQQLVQANLD